MWFGHAWRKLVEAVIRRVNWMEDNQIVRGREREIMDSYKSNY